MTGSQCIVLKIPLKEYFDIALEVGVQVIEDSKKAATQKVEHIWHHLQRVEKLKEVVRKAKVM